MSSSHLIVVSVQDYLRLLNSQVGTGFSFTESIMGFSTNESEVATNLYSALIQFFTVYSDYQKNDFYLTGEVGGWAEMSSIMWVVNGTATFPPIPTLPHPHSHTHTPPHPHTHTPTHPHTTTPTYPHTHHPTHLCTHITNALVHSYHAQYTFNVLLTNHAHSTPHLYTHTHHIKCVLIHYMHTRTHIRTHTCTLMHSTWTHHINMHATSVLCWEVCPCHRLQDTHGEHAAAKNLHQLEGNCHWGRIVWPSQCEFTIEQILLKLSIRYLFWSCPQNTKAVLFFCRKMIYTHTWLVLL